MRVRLGLITALSLPLLFACSLRAQTTDPTVAAADAAYDAKRYAEAIPLYQSVVASKLPDETRARAQWRIGYATYNQGDKQAARAAWLAVADKFPGQARYACESLLRAGNLASAAQDLQGAIDAYARASAPAYCQSEAAGEFAVQATCWLGNAYVRAAEATKTATAVQDVASGRVPTCKDVWDAAAKEFEKAKAAYEQVLALFPTSSLAQEAAMQLVALKYEWALYDRGATYADVVKAADDFIKTYPVARKQLAVVYQVRAEALYTSGRYDDALVDLRIVQDKYGDVAGQALGTSQYFLARCYEGKGDFDRSIKEFKAFLDERKPAFNETNERGAAELEIGAMLRIQKKWDLAAEAFGRVIADFPGTTWDHQATQALESMASDMALAQAVAL